MIKNPFTKIVCSKYEPKTELNLSDLTVLAQKYRQLIQNDNAYS